MPERLPAIEQGLQELSAKVARMQDLLAGAHSLSGPVLYQRVIRDMRELRWMWETHRVQLSEVMRTVVHDAPGTVMPLRSLVRNATAVGHQLEALSSAAWPRNSQIGVRSIRVRGEGVLNAILRQVESEQEIIIPLLSQSPVSHGESTHPPDTGPETPLSKLRVS